MRRSVRLDLGCGNNKQNGYVGVDIFSGREVDVVANLEIPPLPFLTSSVDEVYVSHFLEHTENPNAVIEDIHRILAPHGRLVIKVPQFSNYKGFQQFHKRFFGYTAFDVYDPTTASGQKWNYYSNARFRIVRKELRVFTTWKLPYTFLMAWFARWKPEFYEHFFAFISPAEEIYVEMQAVK